VDELQRIISEIDDQYNAAWQALYGTSQGTAQHNFINARFDRMAELADELATHIGHEDAYLTLIKRMEKR